MQCLCVTEASSLGSPPRSLLPAGRDTGRGETGNGVLGDAHVTDLCPVPGPGLARRRGTIYAALEASLTGVVMHTDGLAANEDASQKRQRREAVSTEPSALGNGRCWKFLETPSSSQNTPGGSMSSQERRLI